MPYVSDMEAKRVAVILHRVGMRTFLTALAVAALMAVVFTLGSVGEVSAQDDAECEVTDLGPLGAEANSGLEAAGQWTTEDCDSRFRAGSDAHTYRFEVVESGRVRIDLTSTEGDSYLYLLSEDGRRIMDNDDGGAGIDARVERDLTPGVYLAEATTVGGRGRGQAGFTIAVSRVEGCDTVHLGTLGSDADLVGSGFWTLDTCGSTFVVEHPAHRYSFNLPQDGRVLIDLTSENGDPVLSLWSSTAGLISANDDGGEGRNSRIKRYIEAGVYLIEATTYLERDLQPLLADFTLTISLVDEDADQQSFLLKVEETHAPDVVVAGVPFPVHYRIGNLGLGDLAEVGGSAWVYVVAPRFYRPGPTISATDGQWESGVSYHTGDKTASETSSSMGGVKPFQVTLNEPGPLWVFVGMVTYNEDEEEIGFHGNWRNLMVLSGFEIDPVTVNVDSLGYEVSAVADEEGEVTTSVTSVLTPDAEVLQGTRAKALYSAGVLTQKLDGIFDRPAVASLPTTGESEATSVADPSSRNLLKLYGQQYSGALRDSGMRTSLREGQSVNPVAVEDILLGMAETASARAVSIVATWKGLQARVGDASPISFNDAFAVHSQLFYAEKVLAPVVAAAAIIEAARDAETGWEDEDVQEMVGEHEDTYACRRPASIAAALRRANVLDLVWMLNADTEMRVASPIYELAVDAVLCADGADDENQQFFESLFIDDSASLLEMFDISPPPASSAPPYRLRIISMLGDDGRVEHGVELSNGEQILPETRHLAADAVVDEWTESSDVMVEDDAIGKISSRRLEDGRVEVSFITASGRTVTPKVRYLPADMPVGVWFRSGNVTAPRPDDS